MTRANGKPPAAWSPEKLPASQLTCGCGRNGYALVICPEHAPIPYTLTERGRREVRRMRQWDAIFDSLETREAASPASLRARRAWATRKARRNAKV